MNDILSQSLTDSSLCCLTTVERLARSSAIWMLPGLSRFEADNLLHGYEHGVFIVRMTSDKTSMVLSYRSDQRVKHVMIKVDLIKGFFMDGSTNVFRNINMLISHYMIYSIQTPDLLLILPKALMEARTAEHFKIFENLKLDFWLRYIANKSINEIWLRNIDVPRKSCLSDDKPDNLMTCPPLPPRGNDLNEMAMIGNLYDVKKSIKSPEVKSELFSKIFLDEPIKEVKDPPKNQDRITSRYMCTICCDKFVDCTLSCGHVFCMSCGEKFDLCPICRHESKIKIKLFLN